MTTSLSPTRDSSRGLRTQYPGGKRFKFSDGIYIVTGPRLVSDVSEGLGMVGPDARRLRSCAASKRLVQRSILGEALGLAEGSGSDPVSSPETTGNGGRVTPDALAEATYYGLEGRVIRLEEYRKSHEEEHTETHCDTRPGFTRGRSPSQGSSQQSRRLVVLHWSACSLELDPTAGERQATGSRYRSRIALPPALGYTPISARKRAALTMLAPSCSHQRQEMTPVARMAGKRLRYRDLIA